MWGSVGSCRGICRAGYKPIPHFYSYGGGPTFSTLGYFLLATRLLDDMMPSLHHRVIPVRNGKRNRENHEPLISRNASPTRQWGANRQGVRSRGGPTHRMRLLVARGM